MAPGACEIILYLMYERVFVVYPNGYTSLDGNVLTFLYPSLYPNGRYISIYRDIY